MKENHCYLHWKTSNCSQKTNVKSEIETETCFTQNGNSLNGNSFQKGNWNKQTNPDSQMSEPPQNDYKSLTITHFIVSFVLLVITIS